jgi:hypothetical protein
MACAYSGVKRANNEDFPSPARTSKTRGRLDLRVHYPVLDNDAAADQTKTR